MYITEICSSNWVDKLSIQKTNQDFLKHRHDTMIPVRCKLLHKDKLVLCTLAVRREVLLTPSENYHNNIRARGKLRYKL